MKNGFDYVATGHYAQVIEVKNRKATRANTVPVDNFKNEKAVGKSSTSKKVATLKAPSIASEDLSTFHLVRSADEFKDQTYFIYNIRTPQLPHLIFPIGGMKKSAVRALAKKIGLPNAEKRESMGLCFVGKIRLKEFLDQKLKPKHGNIVASNNSTGGRVVSKIIGEHEGLAYYTIGQRQGVKVGAGGPWYVVRKDLKKNELVVTNDPKDKELETIQIELHSLNWITTPLSFSKKNSDNKPKAKSNKSEVKLQGRFRHQGELVPLTISELSHNHYLVKFKKPQHAIASGQSLVLYDGKICVGGGVIV